MTPQEQEKMWRDRFILINLVRIGGTVDVLIALLIWHTDMIVEGGSMAIGLPLALLGLFISFWGPKHLARKWRTPPNP